MKALTKKLLEAEIAPRTGAPGESKKLTLNDEGLHGEIKAAIQRADLRVESIQETGDGGYFINLLTNIVHPSHLNGITSKVKKAFAPLNGNVHRLSETRYRFQVTVR